MRGAQESCLWLPGHLASRAAKIWELAQNVVALAREPPWTHISKVVKQPLMLLVIPWITGKDQNQLLAGFSTLMLSFKAHAKRTSLSTKAYRVLAASTRTLSKPLSVGNPYGYCADLKGLGEGKPKRSNAGMGFSRAAEHVPHGGAAWMWRILR